MKKEIIVDIISCLYAVLFLYTGIYKFMDQDSFKQALLHSPLISHFASIVVIGIPLLELLIAGALLIPFFHPSVKSRKWGLYAGTALMAVFTIYIWYMIKTDPDLPCSCGGIIQKMNWHQHLYFNSCFTIFGGIAIWLNNQHLKIVQNNFTLS